jgi:ubiquinone/menaquinone biosynthesis C-methylase UbiE
MPGAHPVAHEAFGPAAEAYERGRPGWPAAALDAIAARLDLSARSSVLDLAAGTGKLTRALVERFGPVTAVEPVDAMRAVLAREVPAARALPGAAEAIPLDDGSVDAVFVAEAFHWFATAGAVAEMKRVLRPGGGVAVLYNRHDKWQETQHPWTQEILQAFDLHRLAHEVDPFDRRPWRDALAARFGELHDDVFENVVRLTPAQLLDQYASFSTISRLPGGRREAALAEFAAILERHGVSEVDMTYRTEVTTAR